MAPLVFSWRYEIFLNFSRERNDHPTKGPHILRKARQSGPTFWVFQVL